MIEYDTIVENLLPMTATERAFRYVYEHRIPYAHAEKLPPVKKILSEDAVAFNIASKIFNELPVSHILSENMIFRPEEDIRVLIHERYHPPVEHRHDFFEIQYVLKGTFSQTIAGSKVFMDTGDFCFIAPGVPHIVHIFDPSTLMVNLLLRKRVFPGAFLNLLSESSDLLSAFFLRALYTEENNHFLINHTKRDENIRFLVSRLIDLRDSFSLYTAKLNRAQFEELFLYILKDHSEDFSSEVTSRKNWKKMLSVLSYIQENYTQVTLHSLAETFHYNPSYLSRSLRLYTGKSFSQIVKDLRLDHAMQLISYTDESIEDIILKMGYTDRTYFYREFKKRFSTTPAEYRKRQILL